MFHAGEPAVRTPEIRARLAYRKMAALDYRPALDEDRYVKVVLGKEDSGKWFLGCTTSTYAGEAMLLTAEAALLLNSGSGFERKAERLLKAALEEVGKIP